jgi:hypothetical protein
MSLWNYLALPKSNINSRLVHGDSSKYVVVPEPGTLWMTGIDRHSRRGYSVQGDIRPLGTSSTLPMGPGNAGTKAHTSSWARYSVQLLFPSSAFSDPTIP